jgi:hypothetical protein
MLEYFTFTETLQQLTKKIRPIKMWRSALRRFSVDSPYRYGARVGVSPHIRSKDFGHDVLLFATPKKLNMEAHSVLNGEYNRERGSAYWEVFAKRTNESIHLLDGHTICDILRAFEGSSHRRDLVTGVCHFVAEDIKNSRVMSKKYKSFRDVVTVSQFLWNYLGDVPDTIYWKIIEALVDTIYQISTVEVVVAIVEQFQAMKKGKSPSEQEALVFRLLVHKLNDLNHTSVEEYTLDKLVEMTNSF